MKNTWRAMMMIAGGLAAYASDEEASGRKITACMEASPNRLLPTAQMKTTAIFARVAVKLEWRTSNRCPANALRISLKESTPPDFWPDALAYAKPYEGSHIVVFWDRIRESGSKDLPDILLAYVMAHEITHMLEGLCRHSSSGLMKARWTQRDFEDMRLRGLPMASEDIELIHLGLDRRNAQLAMRAEAKEYGQTLTAEVSR